MALLSTASAARIAKELQQLTAEPPPGASLWPVGDDMTNLEAQVKGPEGTVYEGGVFRLLISLPARFPFEPPTVRFATPIVHPNIDGQGRICLDILNMPPKGSWSPAQSIRTVVLSLQLLLSEPNPDDGLVKELADEFLHRREAFNARARESTKRHAVPGAGSSNAQAQLQRPGAGEEQPQGQQDEDGANAGGRAGALPRVALRTGDGAGHRHPSQADNGLAGGADAGQVASCLPEDTVLAGPQPPQPQPEAAAEGAPAGPSCSGQHPLTGASSFNATASAASSQQQPSTTDGGCPGPSTASKRPAEAELMAAARPRSRLSLRR